MRATHPVYVTCVKLKVLVSNDLLACLKLLIDCNSYTLWAQVKKLLAYKITHMGKYYTGMVVRYSSQY